jgi:glycosyltransferase involved in cell wall biosynthesis
LAIAHVRNYPAFLREDNHMEAVTKIRVLHLVTRMNVGGVAVLIDNLMSNMDKSRFESLLVTGRCEAPEGDYLDSVQPNYQFQRINVFHKSLSIIDDSKAALKIIRAIRRFKPDVIHTHTSKAGLIGRIFARLFFPKAKVIHTFHGHLLTGYFSSPKLRIILGIERILSLITHELIAMGTQVRDDLVAVKIAPKGKFSVFMPGLKNPISMDKESVRLTLGLDLKHIYCTFIGRLTQIKRPDRVIEVAELVSSQNSQVKFLIVGDGELFSDLNQTSMAKGLPIDFLGWRNDISEIWQASDIALLTSDNEAVALTLIEAAQAGLPIVTTAAGSVRDIAIDGENAIVTPFDANHLAEGILKLAGDSDLRESMGLAGKMRAAQNFSIEQMVHAHQDLYRKALSR